MLSLVMHAMSVKLLIPLLIVSARLSASVVLVYFVIVNVVKNYKAAVRKGNLLIM